MKIACEKGDQTRPGIKLGISGEHGGDPASVKFCHKLGLTYVSCSPFRVPVADWPLPKPPRRRGRKENEEEIGGDGPPGRPRTPQPVLRSSYCGGWSGMLPKKLQGRSTTGAAFCYQPRNTPNT